MRVKFLARTHDWQVSADHESDALPTAPRRLVLSFFVWLYNSFVSVYYSVSFSLTKIYVWTLPFVISFKGHVVNSLYGLCFSDVYEWWYSVIPFKGHVVNSLYGLCLSDVYEWWYSVIPFKSHVVNSLYGLCFSDVYEWWYSGSCKRWTDVFRTGDVIQRGMLRLGNRNSVLRVL